MIIFNGESKALECIKALQFSTIITCKNMYILNIGSEQAILKANKDAFNDDNFKFSAQHAYETKKFKKFINSLLNGVSSNNLNVNDSIIEQLKKEIYLNDSKVDMKNSFIYHIIITAPTDSFADITKVEDIFTSNTVSNYHCFAIEQFKTNENEIRYSLYQSWINKLTLAQCLADATDRKTNLWDNSKLQSFFSALQILLSQDRNLGNVSIIQKSEESCFGLTSDSPGSSLAVNLHLPAIAGKSIRYMTSKTNLEKCIENYNLFLSSQLSNQKA
jgi:hypothetical protein